MNEQLKEFAYESGLLSKRVFDDSWVDNPKLEAKLKKFAELIVRECMSLCTDVEEDVELADYVGGFRDGALMCREDIKKHFGVEE